MDDVEDLIDRVVGIYKFLKWTIICCMITQAVVTLWICLVVATGNEHSDPFTKQFYHDPGRQKQFYTGIILMLSAVVIGIYGVLKQRNWLMVDYIIHELIALILIFEAIFRDVKVRVTISY